MFRAAVLAAAVLATAAVPAVGSARDAPAADPVATAAASCKVPTDDAWGPTYVPQLSVRKVSCATGKAVVKAYHRCRVANGGRKNGTCTHKVKRFRCREQRLSSIKTQFDAKVTCARGAARVTYTYTQYT
ncbi:hypothetical protein [Capillimicrobium parvum]|uniref:Uncharacterized protein n=1 Tax=Capillimicrobium parvum TaxID=2884022 RepID=A0A9E6XYS4_9ACTN|nr:hypothetical protein [Capillimicrobium parvum]UGS36889.1 hypothetical protein DSM104329_03300 [Capillimicrobium parvum]